MPSSAPTTDYTVSADGVRIGFERRGSGPALVLVQGAMGTVHSFRDLTEALADTFTVIVPDRRGRGLSPHPFGPGYTIEDDISDLDAVLRETGAGFVFGLSSGADITLKAALTLSRIEKIALFEPAIFTDGIDREGVERFRAYAAAGDRAGMLASAMKLGQLGPGLMRSMPDWMVKPALRGILNQEAKKGSGEYAPMVELADAFQYDLEIVTSMDGSIPAFEKLTQPVLLLGGSKSPAYLGQTLDRLESVIPNVRRVALDGLGHAAAWNADPRRNREGAPQAVAEQLKAFFRAG